MPQVRLELGQHGTPSMSTRTKKSGDAVHIARAKGRRLDGRIVSIEATGPSPTAARRELARRWETRRGERAGDAPPPPGAVSAPIIAATPTSTSTVAEAVAAWLADEAARGETRPQTQTSYARTARLHVVPALGHLRLHELTAGHITAYLRDTRAGDTPSAVEASLTVLRRAIGFAAQHGALAHDPLLGVAIPKRRGGVRERREIVTPAEAREVLAICDGYSPTLGLVMRVAAESAARTGEILALHADALHLGDGDTRPFITIAGTVIGDVRGGARRQAEGKTPTAHRDLAVSDEVMDRLLLAAEASRQVWPEPEPATGLRPVFPTIRGGWKSSQTLNAELRAALRGSGYEGVSPRTFRRTLATFTAAGQGDQAAADLLGHARVSVTARHYIRERASIRDGASAFAAFIHADGVEE